MSHYYLFDLTLNVVVNPNRPVADSQETGTSLGNAAETLGQANRFKDKYLAMHPDSHVKVVSTAVPALVNIYAYRCGKVAREKHRQAIAESNFPDAPDVYAERMTPYGNMDDHYAVVATGDDGVRRIVRVLNPDYYGSRIIAPIETATISHDLDSLDGDYCMSYKGAEMLAAFLTTQSTLDYPQVRKVSELRASYPA